MADRSAIRKRHIAALIEHRLARRHAVLAALTRASPPRRPPWSAQVYPGLDPRLTAAAAQSLLAHLIELGQMGLARETNGAWHRAD